MNLKPIFCSLSIISVVSIWCSPLHAEVYIGAGVGSSSFDYSDIDNGSAKKFHLGYRFDDKHYAVEIAQIDSGDADIDGGDFNSISVEGINLSLVYNTAATFGKSEPLNAFFKGGIYQVDTEVDGIFFSDMDDSSAGLSLGLGLEYAFTDFFSVRAEAEGLIAVEDFANDESVTFLTVGAQFHF